MIYKISGFWNKRKDFQIKIKKRKEANMQTSKKDSKKNIKEYDQKEFSLCDIKLILLGDSAVGKSKYKNIIFYHLYIFL